MAFFKKKTFPLPPHFRKVRFGLSVEEVKQAENNLEPDDESEDQLTYQLGLLGLVWALDYYFMEGRLDSAYLETHVPSLEEGFPYYHVLKSLIGQKYGEPYLADFTVDSTLLSGWFGTDVLVLLTLNQRRVRINYTPPVLAQGFNLSEL